MSFTIPITIKGIKDVTLPFSLYKDGNFDIFISEFSVEERNALFEITITETTDTGVKFNQNYRANSANSTKFPEFLSAKYKIGVTTKDNSKEQIELFNKYSYSLNFCCQLFFQSPITLTFFGEDFHCNTQHSIQSYARKSQTTNITVDILENFKKTFLLIQKDSTITTKKKHMLASLINISNLQSFNSGLVCSTFITILESLFTDENTEITYRFAMRLTKYLNEDHSFFMNIKKLYGKRSTYYHTGEIKFSYDDEKYLSELTRKIIIEYIQNPENFEIAKLDQLLLD